MNALCQGLHRLRPKHKILWSGCQTLNGRVYQFMDGLTHQLGHSVVGGKNVQGGFIYQANRFQHRVQPGLRQGISHDAWASESGASEFTARSKK